MDLQRKKLKWFPPVKPAGGKCWPRGQSKPSSSCPALAPPQRQKFWPLPRSSRHHGQPRGPPRGSSRRSLRPVSSLGVPCCCFQTVWPLSWGVLHPEQRLDQTNPVCCVAVCPRMAPEPMKATIPPLHILHTRMEHGRICVLQTRIENGRTCILQTSIKHGQTCVLSSWMEHR